MPWLSRPPEAIRSRRCAGRARARLGWRGNWPSGTSFMVNGTTACAPARSLSQHELFKLLLLESYGLVQGTANAIVPCKRPLSSMSPTIISRDGQVVMVIGSPGGSRIITITLEAILNVIDHGMTIQEAIDAPRIHHQWLPDTLSIERFTLSPDTRRLLA